MKGATQYRILVLIGMIPTLIGAHRVGADTPKQTSGELTKSHVRVKYQRIPKNYAEAVATIIDSVWRFYHDDFGLDMPKKVTLSISADPKNRVAIWNDGIDHLTLTLRRGTQLRNPSKSKTHTIYGICHEMAELAASRSLGDAHWLSGTAKDGLSCYFAGEAIDRLYSRYGQRLWPDPYDYREEGTERLKRELRKRHAPPVIEEAARWLELAKLIGKNGLGDTLMSWRSTQLNPKQRIKELRKALPKLRQGLFQRRLDQWLSDFVASAITPPGPARNIFKAIKTKQLTRKPVLFQYDDNSSDGVDCLADDGHIIYFTSPPDQWVITTVHLFGQRFGPPLKKMKYAVITLCDRSLQPIARWERPYGFFRGSHPHWFHINLTPTAVPKEFAISVQFFCEENQGVKLYRDDSSTGHSAIGLPGHAPTPLKEGDWMIRVELDTDKSSNPLLGMP